MSDITEEERAALPVIVDFIRSLGIDVRAEPVEEGTFLPGVVLRDGGAVYDPEGGLHPGDLLHEAGHLALLPPAKRAVAGGDLVEQFPEEAGAEIGVILWSFFACRHLELAPRVVFHTDGYRQESDWLCAELEGGNYIGLPLLEWMGITRTGSDGVPEVVRWLREGP